ncbi:helix-turn-helix domain-containing protein [Streptomyces sp. NPDC056987]|uniref:helix-turn-helix domain-containing protein n=1 Tax=Streptomyces sp. NPDC056987 TaxID=3345988 RepID=UPI003635A8D0
MYSNALVVRRLMQAATRSGALLIKEAAALVDGWAVLADPLAGAVYSTPETAAPDGIRAAAYPQTHPDLVVRQTAGAVLVIGPGPDTSACRASLVARTTAGLLEVRARRAEEMRVAEMRLHTVVLRLLLRGETSLAADVLGDTVTHAIVYRLSGCPDLHAAHQTLWRAVLPTAARTGIHTLVARLDDELAVVTLHGSPAHDTGPALRLIARAAERHRLLAGVSDPMPLDMLTTAWAEAGQARSGATAGHLVPATGLGERALLRIIPSDRLTAWAAAVLQPLDTSQRHVLEAWLRQGSVQSVAPALGTSQGTVRTRLRDIAKTLDVDLRRPTVQAQLLLALRAPDDGAPDRRTITPVALPALAVPTELVSETTAHQWATGLVGVLDKRLRITLRCWLAHRGCTAPAAAELGLHRTTLGLWLEQIAGQLGVDLSVPGIRAELHLAVETVADPADVPRALPRRGGRTYPQ